MSRRRERRRPAARSVPARPAAAGHRWLAPLVAVLVVGAVGAWVLVHRGTGRRAPTRVFPSVMADNAIAGYRAQDWRSALHWARLRAAVEPPDPAWILHLGIVSHNYSFAWTKSGRLRPLTRTSLERIELEARALALVDSAIAGTPPESRWAEATFTRGQIYEGLGLPGEALQSYVALRQRVPGHPAAWSRVAFVEQSLRDPLTAPSGAWAVKSP